MEYTPRTWDDEAAQHAEDWDEYCEDQPMAGYCDNCNRYAVLTFVPFGPGNSVGDGSFCDPCMEPPW